MPTSQPLRIDSESLAELRSLLASPKFLDLPGADTEPERNRCSAAVDELLTRLISGVSANPSASWVLEQFVPTLEVAVGEDTEARERFGAYFERIMDIVGIASSDGLLSSYL